MYREELGLDTMKKTKRQLYRDIRVGDRVLCERDNRERHLTGQVMVVKYKGSEFIELESERGEVRRVEIPYAGNINYVGDRLEVYGFNKRGLTPREYQALENTKGMKPMHKINYLRTVGMLYLKDSNGVYVEDKESISKEIEVIYRIRSRV